jgi:hypothetical protein
LAILGVSFGFYLWALVGADLELANTLAFISLVVSQTFLILFTREWHQIKSNRLLLMIAIGTLLAMGAIILVPPIQAVFHLSSITWAQIAWLLVVPLATMSLVSILVTKVNQTNKY